MSNPTEGQQPPLPRHCPSKRASSQIFVLAVFLRWVRGHSLDWTNRIITAVKRAIAIQSVGIYGTSGRKYWLPAGNVLAR
ncbi:hypothetical protein XENTR_v10024967 [Xenopus tropicalis]|nr:hypothetical protein XENTR_v10024967 [Xenopus tropicalis]